MKTKRFAAVLLLTLLCALLPIFPVHAEDLSFPMWVKAFKSAGERLKMRAEPSESAALRGKYYSGTPVTVLERGAKWYHVRVGARTGYMMKAYLTDAEPTAWGVNCAFTAEAQRAGAYLYAEPSESARRTAASSVRVMGVISEDWLQAALMDGDAVSGIGYVRTTDVTRSARLTVDTGERDKRLNLRAKPDKSATSLALVYNGTAVDELFTYDDPGNAWTRVRLGDHVGYMLTSQLSSAAHPNWMPPVAQTLTDSCPSYTTADADEPSGYLGAGAYYTVVGTSGSRCLVKLGMVGQSDGPMVWAASDALTYAPSASSTWGKLTEDVQTAQGATLAAGSKVQLIRSVGAEIIGYVDASLPTLEVQSGGETFLVDRLKVVYDGTLNLPSLRE